MSGLFVSGITSAFVVVPAIPEMLYEVEENYPESQRDKVNDLTASIFNIGFNLGEIIGPTLGNALYEALGWKTTCDIIALSMLLYSLLYFVFVKLLGTKRTRRVSIKNFSFLAGHMGEEEEDLNEAGNETEDEARVLDDLMAEETRNEITTYLEIMRRTGKRAKTEYKKNTAKAGRWLKHVSES